MRHGFGVCDDVINIFKNFTDNKIKECTEVIVSMIVENIIEK